VAQPPGVPLSAEDRAILALEGPAVVGHTCKVILLGPQAPTVDQLRDAVGRRLSAAPRLTWRLGGPPAAPQWLPDEEFDLGAHVVGTVEPAELDPVAFRAEVARLFTQRLDRRRPLWRMDVVAPLAGGRTAVVWRIHHALADGSTAMHLAGRVLWDEAQEPRLDGAVARAPRPDAAADDARRRHHLGGFLEREFVPSRRSSPFDAPIGPDRDVAFAVVELPALRAAARALVGATVNDAVLAVVAGALRTWLQHRHGPIHAIRAKVPVSLHQPGEPAGNRDSFFCVDLPLGESDPVTRLAVVRAETAVRKSAHDAQEMAALLEELARTSPRLQRWCAELQAGPRAFALNVSNVPGPSQPVDVLGAPVEAIHSLAEIGERHALRIAVVSLAGQLCFGLCADQAVITDVHVLAQAVEHEAGLLIAAGG
jgi:diacylglycerol O-acyltransferase / wax synthase